MCAEDLLVPPVKDQELLGLAIERPARDLRSRRLLDRFRDDVRDAARDHGVTEEQLRDARRHLSEAAARIGALLKAPKA